MGPPERSLRRASSWQASTGQHENVCPALPLLAIAGRCQLLSPGDEEWPGLAQLAMNANTSRQALLLLLFGLVAKVVITLGTIKCGAMVES